jgi:hypothetical protein
MRGGDAAVVGVEILLTTDYAYDVSSSRDHDFRFNDNVLSALISASSYSSIDKQNCCTLENRYKYLRQPH